ncbi:MAG: TraR/DksA family transcriptional regulator [Bryobacteraceae bacterium]|nr:TraR/DksA family transcriptional regulator [Bryobacteraceae bacterium]
MKDTKFLEYRRLLVGAEKEARERLAHERPGINIQTHGDAIDNLIEALDREQSITTSMRASEVLRDIRAAFARMEDGTFGECVRCGEAISQKRLLALPWTPNCIRCQERIDEQRQDNDSLEAA